MVIKVAVDTVDRPGLDDVAERSDPEEEAEKQRYRSEKARLESFNYWPVDSPVNKWDLSKDGFYYLGPKDRVRCVFCFVVLEQFQQGDKVSDEHRRFSPHCPFLKPGHRSGNIPFTPTPSHTPQPYYRYPKYSSFNERISTFIEWPKALKQKPTQLAAAGFFYKGRGDIVQCFSCGGIVKNWEEDDEPWTEHKRHFPVCHFLRENNPNHISTPVKKELLKKYRRTLSSQAIEKGYSEILINKYKEKMKINNWPESYDLDSLLTELEKFKVQPDSHPQDSDPGSIIYGDELDYGRCQQCKDRGCCGTFNCGHCVCCEECGVDINHCPQCKSPVKTIHHSLSFDGIKTA